MKLKHKIEKKACQTGELMIKFICRAQLCAQGELNTTVDVRPQGCTLEKPVVWRVPKVYDSEWESRVNLSGKRTEHRLPCKRHGQIS